MIVPRVNGDPALVFVSPFVRSTRVGLVGVILAIDLAQVGLSITALGIVTGRWGARDAGRGLPRRCARTAADPGRARAAQRIRIRQPSPSPIA